MLELTSPRKHKVQLSDYDYEQDIAQRMLLADVSIFDISLLEEILFSPLKISTSKLSEALECSLETLRESLEKFSSSGLFQWEEEYLFIDKEKRKSFELHLARFEEGFRPGLDFLSELLKKVPIHCLPLWYAIPRTSNHIFSSILEKHLHTPQLFYRYLADISPLHPLIQAITEDLFHAETGKLFSSDLITKYNLSRKEFEELMILLEFHFIGCIVYEKADNHWVEILKPFREWDTYLHFQRTTRTPSIPAESQEPPFFFIQSLEKTLKALQRNPKKALPASRELHKLSSLGWIGCKEEVYHLSPAAQHFLSLSKEGQAAFLYRHPTAPFFTFSTPTSEKSLRAAEKVIKKALHGDWMDFESYFKGVQAPLSEESSIRLIKCGKTWNYTLPSYTEEEKNLFYAVIFEWLYQVGVTEISTFQAKSCFRVTSFGRQLFAE